ncbi:ribonuclease III [Candidatus Wolfebacteria bacterium]|nr:MAG: ribonuclease III [Candidatus Wolfebacteria bacterium]
MTDIKQFEEKLGVKFNDIELLRTAFTHRSYINENRGNGIVHNERLEFLGDAVLELVVTDALFKKFPDKPEGDLTALRSALVNTTTLSTTADSLGMNDYLLLSKGESKEKGRGRQFILADTLEAVIGALYLDQGYDAAGEFIGTHIVVLVDDIIKNESYRDAKSRLQELVQEEHSITPTYDVIRSVGPDHDKVFTVGVFFNKKKIAEGSGKSKQEGEQEAAKQALELQDK